MKMALWLGFIFVFIGLVGVRLAHASHPTVAVHGSELLAPLTQPGPISATFTVLRAKTDFRGNRTLKLEAPDRTQLTLVIPPNVAITSPGPGSTIHLVADQIAPGLLTLRSHDDLQVLSPGTRAAERFVLQAYAYPTDCTAKGGLVVSLYTPQQEFLAQGIVTPEVARRINAGGFNALYGYYTPDHTFIIEDVR